MVFIIFAGCDSLSRVAGPTAVQVHTGTQGLEANFVANTPPLQLFEQTPFNLLLEVSNKGANDLENVAFSISTNPQLVLLRNPDEQRVIQLAGRSRINPNGEKIILNIKAQTQKVSGTSGVSVPISTSFCYQYQTKASPFICVDTDPTNQRQLKKSCDAQEVSLGNGQGGPVSVTRVIPSLYLSDLGDRVNLRIKIFIANQGNGEIIDTSQIENYCAGHPSKDVFNRVSIRAQFQDQVLQCNKEILTLKRENEDENYIECELPQGINVRLAPFLTPVSIILEYGYTFTVSRTMTILPREMFI
ncbi:MAG: hypothetical protein AABX52_03275 [Nanoarchaeota archaeon]